MTRRAALALSLFVFMSVAAVCDVRAAEPDRVELAEMSDGVELSTAIFLPDPGVFTPPYPTVLMRTPYPNVLGALPSDIADMVINYMVDMFGLALVIQDTRGTGDSGGEPDAFFHDSSDGPDTVEWLLTQDWCNGNIMQFGLSALAIPGYLAAPGASDAMRCQFLGEGAPDMYNLAAFHGGVFKKDTVESWLSWVGASSMLGSLSGHRTCDDFWNPLMLDRIEGEIKAAAVHVGGWYDVFTEGTIAGYRAYIDRGDEWASAHQYLVMGPWDHWQLANALGDSSGHKDSLQLILLGWTSFCLAGDKSQIAKWPHVRYFVMGSGEEGAPGNEWREADDWPLPNEYREFSISDAGVLESSDDVVSTTGWAREAPDALEPTDTVEPPEDVVEPSQVLPVAIGFDHRDYSPVVGGRNLTGTSGRMELGKVLSRSDYVMFASEPLAEPFESIGRMSAVFEVSTKYPDADIVVRLADVQPDGSAWIISDGAIRLSRRGACDQVLPVEPGVTYEVEVDLLQSAMVFNTGHRLALIVTSTMYPKYELNPALEAESIKFGPLEEAFVIHKGRLMMPVAAEPVPVPDSVETAELVEVAEDVSDVVDILDAEVREAGDVDTVAVDVVVETTEDDVAVGTDLATDLFVVDARDASTVDVSSLDSVVLDTGSGADHGGFAGGGCSSTGARPGSPFGLILLLLACLPFVVFIRVRG
ncbi:MAG TPA: CocE/NonD family hydrolase [Myxococcota bacterium]|nr:CocE/NonD family hydrolase [Myxococcota bacterium]HQP96515.1 CocE/NonD family hydrolase [Myxococcota bacterium]